MPARKKSITTRPKINAALLDVGSQLISTDGTLWVIHERTNGKHYWKKSIDSTTKIKKSTRKGKQSTRKGKKPTTKSKKPTTKSKKSIRKGKKSTTKGKKPTTLSKKSSPKKKKPSSSLKTRHTKDYLDSIRGSYTNYLDGYHLVLTGTLWDSLDNIIEFLTIHGAKVTNVLSQSRNTVLISGNKNPSRTNSIVKEAIRKNLEIVYFGDLMDELM